MLPKDEATARELLDSVDFISAAKTELDEQNRDALDHLADKATVERLRGNEEAARQIEALRDRVKADDIETHRDVTKLLDAE